MGKYLEILKNKHFRYFVLAYTLLDLGKKLSWVALSWFVYEITGSTYSTGIIITVTTLAPILASIFVGNILDRYNRRTIMIWANSLRGLSLLFIPVMYWFDLLTVSFIAFIMFINGILSVFTSVGAFTILPSFVKKDDLEVANAVSQMSVQTGYLIGPAIGGFLTALFGAPITILINVICFLFASFLYYLISDEAFNKGRKINNSEDSTIMDNVKSFWMETKEGFKFLWSYPVLISIPFITFFFNLTYAPLEPVLSGYVSTTLNSGPEALGTLWTIFAVGSFFGAFLYVKLDKKFTYSIALGSTIFLWGAAATVLGFSPTIYISFIIMFFGGIVYAPYNIIAPTLEQKLVPNEIRGRVIGVIYFISGLSFPLGTYLGGILGDWVGIRETIIISGIATITLGITVMLLKPLRFKEISVLPTKKSEKTG
ncbi:MFS transporter [Fictibacillus sp. 23RED33]|uniref:MFS transporter n=1 Tax=Fictibacillus sp. 23RED33 TaxID=2745879 RepID=UPI0018CF4F89|nr:MFS transporter [Fictibacillus sp. 23RED33]MBH0175654.1 MFS transporter [Fictibacillus sp. 23RED33]